MAQATKPSTTSVSRFHNVSDAGALASLNDRPARKAVRS